MIGTPTISTAAAELVALRHAAMIRIEQYLFRVTIWTREEWDALPVAERPAEAAPLERIGWHWVEPVNPALWFAPGDLVEEAWSQGPGSAWPPSPPGWSPPYPLN